MVGKILGLNMVGSTLGAFDGFVVGFRLGIVVGMWVLGFLVGKLEGSGEVGKKD